MDLIDNLGMIRVHAAPDGALVLTCTGHPAWECTVGSVVGVDTLDVVAQHHLRDGHARVQARFTCPKCGRSSSNPNDLREGYCGACHEFTAVGVG